MDRPNILWYCSDQQRSDTIHALGNPNINTPNLDRLAANGVAFNRAYTQCPICTPSRATFLTGRYPSTHHVQRNGNDFFPDTEVLVTKILADAGYDCGLAGKLHLSRAKGRLEQRPDDGYRYFQWSHHPMPDWGDGHHYEEWLRNEKGVDPQELYTPLRGKHYCHGVPEELHQTTWCTEMALRFIDEERDGPWLMSLNPFDPHPPFDPPAEYADRYNPEDLPYPVFTESDIEHQQKLLGVDQQTKRAVHPITKEYTRWDTRWDRPDSGGNSYRTVDTASVPPADYDPRTVVAHYYGMVELLDRQFGRIIDHLDHAGQLENTLVIYTSDHGELLGDHGLLYKGCRFYESLVHVPLIMAWGNRFKKGLRSDALVELVDLPETILEAAGLDVPRSMQGKSLLPILEGKADADIHKSHVISEFWDAIDLPAGSHGSMYFDGRYKSCVYHDQETGELYDLETDPSEFDDLWDTPEMASLKSETLFKHFNAMMAASTAGVERTDSY